MALPTFVNAGTVASGAGTISPGMPASISTNDILLMFAETAGQAITVSGAGGGTWTEVTNSPQSVGASPPTDPSTRLTCFWSRYDGSQTAPTLSDSGNHQVGRIFAFRGCETSGNPWNITSGGTEATSDTSISATGTTTTLNNCLVVIAVTTSGDAGVNGTAEFSSWTNTDLSNVTEIGDNMATAGNGGGLGVATGQKATAGAYGATTVTCATAGYHAFMTIALRPTSTSPTVSLNSPADASSDSDTTPTLDFTGTDAEGDDVRYNVQINTDSNFGISSYYFDVSDAGPTDSGSAWTNDANAFDGSTATSATSSVSSSTSSNFLFGEGTNAPTSGNTISQVRARIYGHNAVTTFFTVRASIYTNGLAELLGTANGPGETSDWGSYVTLSTPSGGWTWQKVNDLEVKIWGDGDLGIGIEARMVEVEVSTGVLLDKVSGTDSGFANPDTGGDTDPFNSGENIQFTVQAGDSLAANTYYWRVRGIDPSGGNIYGAWSSTRSFTISSGTTTTQTILGKARIQITSSQTIQGLSRINKSVSQTILGKARIIAITTRTVLGKARITTSTSKTVQGLSRISKVVSQTVLGKSRIEVSTLRTILGKADILKSTAQTVLGKATIVITVSQTILGKSRITVSSVKTITGKADILKSASQTIQGKSRITITTLRTILGLSRITKSVSRTIQGKADIFKSTTQTILGKARITVTTTKTILGKSRIGLVTLKTILGKSRVEKVVTQTVLGKARISVSGVLKTISGKSRITVSTLQLVLGIARISASTTKTILGKASVQLPTLKTITGKAYLVVTSLRTITGRSNIKADTQQHITGRAYIRAWMQENPTTGVWTIEEPDSGIWHRQG